MAWSLVGLVILASALAAPAYIRWRRRRLTNDSPSRAHPSASSGAVPPRPSRPPAEPEQAPVKSCPVCLSEYSPRNRFCVRDGAALMESRPSVPFAPGLICPTCRRGYPSDASFCPEDADELMPYGLYGAASSTRSSPWLESNKICPECGVRHAPAHLFCGHDGTQLVVVN